MSISKPNLTIEKRNAVAQFLLESFSDGKLAHGKINEAASKFGLARKIISRIWIKAQNQIAQGTAISLINGKSLMEHAKNISFDQARLETMEKRKRCTFRSIAREMGVGKSIVGRWYKRGLLKAHTNTIKPTLSEKNKYSRIRFSLEALEVDQNVIKCNNMQQIVHIDEKWFNLTRTQERYYLCQGEEEPYRSCQSKRFITKVMFLCAVARPLYSENGECVFDGKIGIVPFTQKVPAKRNLKNRTARTLETKPLDSITKEVTKQCLINQVIPAIKAKWPSGASKNIIIQQDNASPHLGDNDPDFRVAATSDGFNIHIIFQPPNGPDTNINDLGWFRALQSLQVERLSYNVDDLLAAVESSFENLSHSTLNRVFLSLQACMVEIIKCKGHNDYKLTHMKKEALMRAGTLPYVLQIDQVLVKEAITHLVEANEAGGWKISSQQLINCE